MKIMEERQKRHARREKRHAERERERARDLDADLLSSQDLEDEAKDEGKRALYEEEANEKAFQTVRVSAAV